MKGTINRIVNTLPNSERLNDFGDFLHSTSLYELWNVLKKI